MHKNSYKKNEKLNSGINQIIISKRLIRLTSSKNISKNTSKISNMEKEKCLESLPIQESEFRLPKINSNKILENKYNDLNNLSINQRNNVQSMHNKFQDYLIKIDKSHLFDLDVLDLKDEKSYLPFIDKDNKYNYVDHNRYMITNSPKNQIKNEEIFHKLKNKKRFIRKIIEYNLINKSKIVSNKKETKSLHKNSDKIIDVTKKDKSYNKWFIPSNDRFGKDKNIFSVNEITNNLQKVDYIYEKLHDGIAPFVYESPRKTKEYLKRKEEKQNQLETSFAMGKFRKYLINNGLRVPLAIKNYKLDMFTNTDQTDLY